MQLVHQFGIYGRSSIEPFWIVLSRIEHDPLPSAPTEAIEIQPEPAEVAYAEAIRY
jgi:hypothetical protein